MIRSSVSPKVMQRTRLPVEEAGTAGFPTMKVLLLLETVVRAVEPLTVSEIHASLGIPKPTAYRLVRMLEGEALLQREPGSKRYGPGPRLFRLGLDVVASSTRAAPRRAVLEALSREVGETCNFGMMVGAEVVYLDRVEAAWPLGLRFEPGSRVPLHCTAIGKLLLSFVGEPQRRRLLAATGMPRYTENTITDPEQLEQELDGIRAVEVSIDNQEFLAGVVCVAVPVRAPGGRAVAGLAVSAPSARMSVSRAMQFVPALKQAAKRMQEP